MNFNSIFVIRFFFFFLAIFFFFNLFSFFFFDPSIVIYNLVTVFFLLVAFYFGLSSSNNDSVRSKFFYSSVFYFLYHRSITVKRILFFSFLDKLYDYVLDVFIKSFDSFKNFLVYSLYLYVYKYINYLIKKKHTIRMIVLKSCYSKTVNLFFRSFF